jgi:flagellar motor switch protein FliN/FliY
MPDQPSQEEIDRLMKALGAEAAAAPAPAPSTGRFTLDPLPPSPGMPPSEAGLEMLDDVEVSVRVELGSSKLEVQEILKLGPGSVVALDTLTSEPVNIYVNDRLVARGEVLVVDDNFAVKITEVVPPSKPS